MEEASRGETMKVVKEVLLMVTFLLLFIPMIPVGIVWMAADSMFVFGVIPRKVMSRCQQIIDWYVENIVDRVV